MDKLEHFQRKAARVCLRLPLYTYHSTALGDADSHKQTSCLKVLLLFADPIAATWSILRDFPFHTLDLKLQVQIQKNLNCSLFNFSPIGYCLKGIDSAACRVVSVFCVACFSAAESPLLLCNFVNLICVCIFHILVPLRHVALCPWFLAPSLFLALNSGTKHQRVARLIVQLHMACVTAYACQCLLLYLIMCSSGPTITLLWGNNSTVLPGIICFSSCYYYCQAVLLNYRFSDNYFSCHLLALFPTGHEEILRWVSWAGEGRGGG